MAETTTTTTRKAPSLLVTGLCGLGLILSLYMLYAKEHEYDEHCRFHKRTDKPCTSVLSGPETYPLSYLGLISEDSMLDWSMAFWDVLYYSVVLAYEVGLGAPVAHLEPLFLCNWLAGGSSTFLAFHLAMSHQVCIVCWMTHLINFILLFSYLLRLMDKLHRQQIAREIKKRD